MGSLYEDYCGVRNDGISMGIFDRIILDLVQLVIHCMSSTAMNTPSPADQYGAKRCSDSMD